MYVQLPDREKPTFEGRSIVLGPRAGDFYIVREDGPGGANLAEGELLVVRGSFKIDSALQIQARPSMMSPVEKPGKGSKHVHGKAAAKGPHKTPAAFQSQLAGVVDAYLAAILREEFAPLNRFIGRIVSMRGSMNFPEHEVVDAFRAFRKIASDHLLAGLLEGDVEVDPVSDVLDAICQVVDYAILRFSEIYYTARVERPH